MRNKKIVWYILGVASVLAALLFIQNAPLRLFTSTLWAPDTHPKHNDKIIVIEMSSNNSWPILSKSIGNFLQEHALANIIIIPFRQVTLSKIDSHHPKAVILGGYLQSLDSYKDDEMIGLFDFLNKTSTPVLGICGGMQFIGKAFGSQIVTLENMEKGFVDVSIKRQDPILKDLPNPIKVFNWHKNQVDPLPYGFLLLGTNNSCRIHIMKLNEKMLYGVQFHPEFSSAKYPDGIKLMKNFLTMANISLKVL
jgi:GMP synthase (glutamine-hydrolysing)